MSLNKQPSYVGINEKEGTFTVAFLPTWYNTDRCYDCPRFQMRPEEFVSVFNPRRSRKVAYCECMEAEDPCEITGERYTGEENGIET